MSFSAATPTTPRGSEPNYCTVNIRYRKYLLQNYQENHQQTKFEGIDSLPFLRCLIFDFKGIYNKNYVLYDTNKIEIDKGFDVLGGRVSVTPRYNIKSSAIFGGC